MKKILLTLSLVLAVGTVLAQSWGRYNVTLHGWTNFTQPYSSPVYVYNGGTNVIYISYGGGYISGSTTSVPSVSDYQQRLPVRPAASYTTRGSFNVVSVYCPTNGLFDIGFEGRP